MTDDDDKSPAVRVQVWDGPVRLFHWLLVALVAFSWWSAENDRLEWHVYSGYIILGLIIFRIYWGLVGSSTARFSSFVKGPRTFFTYAGSLLRRPRTISFGHNPMGGWSVVALLAVLVLQTATGLFSVDVDGLNSGSLSYLVSFHTGRQAAEIHEFAFNLLLALVGLHLFAIAFYEIVRGERLIHAMISGKKPLPTGMEPPAPRFAHVWRAGLGILLSAGIAYAVAKGFRF